MITGWQLPREAAIGDQIFRIRADYRDILEIFGYLQDPDLPEFLRWQVALTLFYEEPVPENLWQQAAEYFVWFVGCGRREPQTPGPKLLDWEQDAEAIVADVNRAAGQEIRSLKFLHWWTFMSWFHAIGEGQVSALVGIREKLRRGQKLEGWEKNFYSRNRSRVELQKKYSAREREEREQLQRLLG